MQITIEIDNNTAKTIKQHFNTTNDKIIKESAQDIIDRYLHVEYLDPNFAVKNEINTLK